MPLGFTATSAPQSANAAASRLNRDKNFCHGSGEVAASNPSPIKKRAMKASPMGISRVQIYPEQHQGSGPPQQPGTSFGGIEQHQENTGQQQRKHLGTNSPGRGGGQRTPERHDRGDVGPARRAQENQEERRSDNGGKGHDESAESRQPIDAEQQDVRKPFVVYPGLAEARERIRIGMEDAVVLQDQLPGAKVPPDVWVSQRAHGHGEQAECEDGYAHMASL